MDIFPKLLGEAEFRNFTESDYAALAAVLDDVTANYICQYRDNPDADQTIVKDINQYLGEILRSLTFHLELKNSGVIELVQSLAPESLPYSQDNLDELIERLSYLEKNQNNIRATIPHRTSSDCAKFGSAIFGVVSRMLQQGITPTYPDIPRRFEANKFLFYQSGEKDHSTGVGILNSKKRQWVLALNGARWLKYCAENNIPYESRSAF